MSSIRIPVHLLMSNYQFEKIETFEFWDPTVLKVILADHLLSFFASMFFASDVA